jgi:PAS domain S-box-containing protein
MAATKIGIFSVAESRETSQAIQQFLARQEDIELDFDWTTDLVSGIAKLQRQSTRKYDLYIVDDRAFSTQKNSQQAISVVINLLKPASVILLTDDYATGLNAIKSGSLDYWHKQELTIDKILRSIYLFINYRQKSKLSETEIYRQMFYNSYDGIFLLAVDENENLVYESINPVYAEKVGTTPLEIVGKTIAEVLPEENLKIIERKLHSCIETQQPITYEVNYRDCDRNRIYHTTIVPIIDNTGKVSKLQGSSRDLTAEKEAIANHIRQTRYRHLLRSLALKIHQSSEIQEILQTSVREILKALQVDRVLLWRVNNGKRQIVAETTNRNIKPVKIQTLSQNENFQQTYPIEESKDITVDDRFDPDSDSLITQNLFQGEKVAAYLNIPIYQMLSSHGIAEEKPQIWGILSLHQCYHPRRWSNEEIGILEELANQLSIAIYQDELLQTEVRKKQELMRSNAELEQFAYIASHDLQAPLQTIGNYSKLLQRRYQQKLDEKADKFLRYIVEAAQRMQNQIDDLLEYSRIGKRDKNYETIDCQSVLDKAISNLRLSIDKNQAKIQILTPLPNLVVDSNQFLLLWQNLIANAIKYRTEEPPSIVISCKSQGNFWLFEIADNGIGIDPKYYKRIFQIFQRLHTQEEYPGTGIGLAICQRIVENHHGRIWVESNNDRGTKFCLTIATKIDKMKALNIKSCESFSLNS